MIDFENKTATLRKSFKLKSFDEALPAGQYDIEIDGYSSDSSGNQEKYVYSVILHLHPCVSNPGLKRTLQVPLVDLEAVLLKDKMASRNREDPFLEEMMADPLIHLMMQADGYSEAEVRNLHSPCESSINKF